MAQTVVILNTLNLNERFKRKYFTPLATLIKDGIDVKLPLIAAEGLSAVKNSILPWPSLMIMYIRVERDLGTAESMANWANENKVPFGYLTSLLDDQINHMAITQCQSKKLPRGRFSFSTTVNPAEFHARVADILAGKT